MHVIVVARKKKANKPLTSFHVSAMAGWRNYLRQGTKIALRGRIQTGNFTNKEGQKVYTTDVIAEEIEFAESKRSGDSAQPSSTNASQKPATTDTSFMDVPDSVEEELPWS